MTSTTSTTTTCPVTSVTYAGEKTIQTGEINVSKTSSIQGRTLSCSCDLCQPRKGVFEPIFLRCIFDDVSACVGLTSTNKAHHSFQQRYLTKERLLQLCPQLVLPNEMDIQSSLKIFHLYSNSQNCFPFSFDKGEATVYSVDHQKNIQIEILKCQFEDAGHISFTAYDCNTPKEIRYIGSMSITFLRNHEDGRFGSQMTGFDECCEFGYYYGLEKNAHKVNEIAVTWIESKNNTKYKGVGTALMQAAMEYSYSKNCEGRVLLKSLYEARVFYYKLGMRTKSSEEDREISLLNDTSFLKNEASKFNLDSPEDLQKVVSEKLTLKGFKLTGQEVQFVINHHCLEVNYLGISTMHMPEEARGEWRQKIINNPIFKNPL